MNIDDPVLEDLRALQRRDKKPLGQLVSELLVIGLRERRSPGATRQPFSWTTSPMGARVDLDDKEAVRDVLDERDRGP